MATLVTGKLLQAPFRVLFDSPPAGTREFNFTAAQLGGNADLNEAKLILMYVDGLLFKASAHSISAPLQIISDDPNGQPGGGWDASAIEFIITFL